jgi:hypothetical protein
MRSVGHADDDAARAIESAAKGSADGADDRECLATPVASSQAWRGRSRLSRTYATGRTHSRDIVVLFLRAICERADSLLQRIARDDFGGRGPNAVWASVRECPPSPYR